MDGRSAILFLIDDRYRTGRDVPLMLRPVMGVPLLKWLTFALSGAEVNRFFLACPPAYAVAALACFPETVSVTAASDAELSDRLHVFLSTAPDGEEDVWVVTGPVLYLPGTRAEDQPANAVMISRRALMDALDEETVPIGSFLRRAGDVCTQRDGFFSVSAPEELPDWQSLLTGSVLRRLTRDGVEVWDMRSCWVEPGVEVGLGTTLLPGTVLQGKTKIGFGCTVGPNTRVIDSVIGSHSVVEQSRLEGVQIGANAQVGPFANLRPGTVLDARAKAGAFVELKNAALGADVKVPHLSYLGDAAVGEGTNVGCGTVTANFDRVEKHRTVIEPEAFIGCNTTLVAPVTVGKGAYVGAGSVVTEDIPAQALAIGRARQQNRKEWAIRNKQPE